MKRQYSLLLHPAFIASLFLLLLNDISLKYQFHNGLTGKLSDFTGLFVFALFGMAIYPSHRKKIAIFAGIFFIWWKSPLSTFFIEWWNESIFITVHRVVDYSDLTALIVLPLAILTAERHSGSVTNYRRIFIPVIGCITIFSFCFTSVYRYGYQYYSPDEIAFNYNIDTRLSEQQILDKFHQQNISFTIDSISYYPAREYSQSDAYVMRVTTAGPDSVKWIPVDNRADSTLYVRRNEGLYYTLSKYNAEDVELEDLKIFISKNKSGKDTRINIERFRWNKGQGDYTNKVRRKLRKQFKKFFGK